MPGSLSRQGRIEYAAIAGYVVLVAVIAVMTSVKATMVIFGKTGAWHGSPTDMATVLGQVLYASSDFIAAACLLLLGTLMLYNRRRRKATAGAVGQQAVRRSGPPFLL